MKLDDFKICIHNLFLGPKTNACYILQFNLFYDYVCNCNQKKFSLLFYQILMNSNSQRVSESEIQGLATDVRELSQQNEENDFVELLNLLQQFLKNQQSLAISSFLTKYISFFSQDILKQLKGFTNQDMLWKGYIVLFQQEIIELIENQFIKNNIPSQLVSNQIFQQYEQQIQNIQVFNQSQPMPRFSNITQKYSDIIQQYRIDQYCDDVEIINCPLLTFRQEVYKFLKEFNTFQDYKNTCNQQKIQPIFNEINYSNIIYYEEMLKNGQRE
ncbi:unnamed protein product (macronuclear) [Paramecium tetraurelia]|uniref:Uncharacterized protein n=1 Tax=Paramecium tetraurelia TaxID=5888 RepID=A0D0U8_PARTE|nr:uncharacterized protein GSPATT00012217001 [Paramecium tetraurelia]CAK76665.1 unnamed protein product [Paramecium tetraurelia]|eukprot:XP_001444062.1 hypothetical protein (macronuclear) [Paramecium tetraurelia strain d4-2]